MADLAKLEAITAIWVAAKYDRKERLLAYLRSNKPLTEQDRAYLADYLEGKLKRKKGPTSRWRGRSEFAERGRIGRMVQKKATRIR